MPDGGQQKVVPVPGVGIIAFPGAMDDATINSQIQDYMLKTGQGMMAQGVAQGQRQQTQNLPPSIGSVDKSETPGVMGGLYRNTVGMYQGMKQAATAPATPQERQAFSSAGGMAADSGQATTDPTKIALFLHRLINEPSQATSQEGSGYFSQASKEYAGGHPWNAIGDIGSGAADKTLAMVPMVGPWINSVANRAQSGDTAGALTDIAMAKLSEKVVEGTDRAITKGPRGALQSYLNAGTDLTKNAVEKWQAETSKAIDDHQAKVDQLMQTHADDTFESILARAKQVQQINKAHAAKIADIDARHGAVVDKINQQNQSAQQAHQQRQQLQGEATQLQQHLGEHLNVIKDEAKAEAVAKFPKIQATADSGEVAADLKQSMSKLQGSQNLPSAVSRIMGELQPKQATSTARALTNSELQAANVIKKTPGLSTADGRSMAQNLGFAPNQVDAIMSTVTGGQEASSTEIPYEKLQGYRSEIGEAMSNPNLPGDVKAALTDAYGKLSERMRSMAKAEGKEGDFLDANAAYRKYMQTFNDTRSLKVGGSPIAHAVRSVDPEYISQPLTGKATVRAQQMLGEYSHLGARPELIQSLMDKTTQMKDLPSTFKPKEAPPSPAHPNAKYPEWNMPQKPNLPTLKTNPPPDPRALKADAIHGTAESLKSMKGIRGALDLLSIIHAMEGNPQSLLYPVGRRAMSHVLLEPKALEYLSKPKPEELAMVKQAEAKIAAKKASMNKP